MLGETYIGALEEHVHYNNQQLINGESLKLFGIDGIDERTTWLDLKNCSGTLNSVTFSLLPNLEYINLENCKFEECSNAFAPLENLKVIYVEKGTFPLQSETFEGNSSITSLSLQDINIPEGSVFQHLIKLVSITFDTCIFQSLSKDLFSGLNSLKQLSISNCKIEAIVSGVFDEINNLQELNIRDCEIKEIDFNIFSKLSNLKFLSFHHNKCDGNIDYAVFEQLPLLNTIHFDLDIYSTISFDSFPHLQTVRIGYTDTEEDSETNELVEKLTSKNIKSEYVFCGTLDCDSSDLEECC